MLSVPFCQIMSLLMLHHDPGPQKAERKRTDGTPSLSMIWRPVIWLQLLQRTGLVLFVYAGLVLTASSHTQKERWGKARLEFSLGWKKMFWHDGFALFPFASSDNSTCSCWSSARTSQHNAWPQLLYQTQQPSHAIEDVHYFLAFC